MTIYGIEYLDYLGEDTVTFEYYANKKSAEKRCKKLNKEHDYDTFGKYQVEEIEVIEN